MENPFELIEQRLAAIDEKLDSIAQKMDDIASSSNLSTTWITKKQLAEHLGVSTPTIDSLRGRKIPFYKIGRRIMFKKEEVDEFISKTRHKSGGEYLDEYLSRNR